MYPNNQPASATPPAGQTGGVWPPPASPHGAPTSQGPDSAAQTPWFMFKEEYRRIEGHVSDFREGALAMNENGIYIQGKMVPREEIQIPIYAVTVPAGVIIALIVQIVIENSMRSPASLHLPWSSVKGIVFIQNKQMVCLIFSSPNYRGKIKTFSLPFRLAPDAYAAFEQTAQGLAPNLTRKGSIGRTMMPLTRVLLVYILVGLPLFFAFVYAVSSAGTPHH